MLLGFDIGGTKCAVITARWENGQIELLKKEKIDTDLSVAPEEMVDRLIALADGIVEEKPEAIGISCGGPLDSSRGIILGPPNLPGWDHVEIVDRIQKHFGAPAHLQNDANACAVAEWKFGAGMGCENMVFLTFGTGLGAGLILNGKLYSGGGMVGEVGHMVIEKGGVPCNCGRRGCWEAYSSATGLIRMTKEAMEQHPESLLHKIAAENGGVEGRTAFQAAEAGDETALEVCKTFVEYLAAGVTNLVNVLQPEILAVGGGVAGAPDHLLMEPLRKIVEAECYPRHTGKLPRILRAELGNDAGIIGAALLSRAI